MGKQVGVPSLVINLIQTSLVTLEPFFIPGSGQIVMPLEPHAVEFQP